MESNTSCNQQEEHNSTGTNPGTTNHRLEVTASAVLVDREEDDVETGALPVIQLPPQASCCREASNANLHTVPATLGDDGGDLETAHVQVEAPQDGSIRPEELEHSPIAQLVSETTSYSINPHQQQQQENNGASTAFSGPDCTTMVTEDSSSLCILERRAEFISATVIKEEMDTPLGIELTSDNNDNHDVIISAIHENSLLSNTPFREGDRLLSVNTKRCYIMDAKAVMEFMSQLVGNVTLVIHNAGGDPNLVESMITRPIPNAPCGLGLASSGRHHLRISNIQPNGLFYDSLLNSGDPIVCINGEPCEFCDAQDAGDIIARSGIYITIKARTLLETGVVVAAFSSNNSTGSNIPPQIVNAMERARRNNEVSASKVIGLTLLAVVLLSLLLTTTLF